jgi:AraC-like DNA-binding protein
MPPRWPDGAIFLRARDGDAVRDSPIRLSSGLPSATGGISRLACARAEQAGIDWQPLAQKAGISIEQIEDRNFRIGVRKQIALLDLVADALHDEFLGFHLARDFDLREIGLLYYVLASSQTIGDALQRAVRYSTVTNEGVSLSNPHDPAALAIDYVGVSRLADRHQMEFLLTTLVRTCRQLTNLQLSPVRVSVIHHRKGDPSEFERFLGCHIVFGAGSDEIAFAGTVNQAPVIGADPYLNDLLIRYCEETLSRRRGGHVPLRTSVENAIAPLLPHGGAHLREVAAKLGMSERTLSRRLAKEGATFVGILSDMRSELAMRYLREDLSISQIAWLLGYREVSAFTHAFRRWSGKTPKEARAQGLSEGG